MLGNALYYPHIDVPDSTWLRSAILFWDKVQTIVPESINVPYRSLDAIICAREGYLEPLHCELHQDVVKEVGMRVSKLLEHPKWRNQLNPGFLRPVEEVIEADKLVQDMRSRFERIVGIHPSKIDSELRAEIIRLGGLELDFPLRILLIPNIFMIKGIYDRFLRALFSVISTNKGHWITVNGRFASVYMTVLAQSLATKIQASALTNEKSAWAVNLNCIMDEAVESGNAAFHGVLVSLVMEGLKLDPEIPMHKILTFRRTHTDQLAELSGCFDELKSKIEKSSTSKELEEGARSLYENKIRPCLQRLKRELESQTIQSIWEGIQKGITVSAPAGGVLAAATGFSGTMLLGAAAFITLADVGVKSYLARARVRASSPYTYLLDIERKFSLPALS